MNRRDKAQQTTKLMTDWATDIVLQDANPIVCISHTSMGKASLYVNKNIDPANVVLMLRTLANQFEEQEANRRGIL